MTMVSCAAVGWAVYFEHMFEGISHAYAEATPTGVGTDAKR